MSSHAAPGVDRHRKAEPCGQAALRNESLDLFGDELAAPVVVQPDLAHGAETCDALGRGREVTFGERQLLAPVRVVVHRGGVQSHHRDALPRVAAAEVEQRSVAFGVYAREQQVLHARRPRRGASASSRSASNAVSYRCECVSVSFIVFSYIGCRAVAVRLPPVPALRAGQSVHPVPVRSAPRGFPPPAGRPCGNSPATQLRRA